MTTTPFSDAQLDAIIAAHGVDPEAPPPG